MANDFGPYINRVVEGRFDGVGLWGLESRGVEESLSQGASHNHL